MGDLSQFVAGGGELLGVDFSCGAPLRIRPVSRKRLRKALRRKRRLKWFRNLGGRAHEVARGGMVASVAHGAHAYGIPCAVLRDMRRIQAASSSVRASGASATAKLAIGGHEFRDVDPAVSLANPPLLMIADTLWDSRSARADHVVAWRRAKQELEGTPRGRDWKLVRGPVGAAWLHLERMDATWRKPFVITLLDVDIDLLEVPPRAVARAIREHARRHPNRILITSLAAEFGWNLPAVVSTYAKGIDWALVRDLLRGKRGGLTILERRAFMVLVAGAAWPEERRWRIGGMLPSGTCLSCFLDVGPLWHKNNQCGFNESRLTWMRMSGRSVAPRAQSQSLRLWRRWVFRRCSRTTARTRLC